VYNTATYTTNCLILPVEVHLCSVVVSVSGHETSDHWVAWVHIPHMSERTIILHFIPSEVDVLI